MMHDIKLIALAVTAMTQAERDELGRELRHCLKGWYLERYPDELLKEPDGAEEESAATGDTPDAEATGKPARKRKAKGGGKKTKRPFWLKVVTGIDPEKKGGYAVEGDWIWDTNEAPAGASILLGTRIDGKVQWALLRAAPGSGTTIKASDTLTFELKGASLTVPLTGVWSKIAGALA